MGEVSPCAAISLIAPYGPHGAISEIRRYPLCGDTPQRPVTEKHVIWLVKRNRLKKELPNIRIIRIPLDKENDFHKLAQLDIAVCLDLNAALML